MDAATAHMPGPPAPGQQVPAEVARNVLTSFAHLPRPTCVRFCKRRSCMCHVVGTFLERVRAPLTAFDTEEVATVNVNRACEQPQGIRDSVDNVLTEHSDVRDVQL